MSITLFLRYPATFLLSEKVARILQIVDWSRQIANSNKYNMLYTRMTIFHFKIHGCVSCMCPALPRPLACLQALEQNLRISTMARMGRSGSISALVEALHAGNGRPWGRGMGHLAVKFGVQHKRPCISKQWNQTNLIFLAQVQWC